MTSYKTYTLIKLMTLWNTFNQLYTSCITKTQKVYKYILDFYYGHHDIWIFMNGHLTPVSFNNIHNVVEPEWTYDAYNNELKLFSKDNELNTYKFSWLSSKIRISDIDPIKTYKEYEIDSFIENLKIKTDTNNPPTLFLIFMCWSIYTKHWYKTSHNIEFYNITDMGDEEVLNLSKHNTSLQIKNKEIYAIIENRENAYNDLCD